MLSAQPDLPLRGSCRRNKSRTWLMRMQRGRSTRAVHARRKGGPRREARASHGGWRGSRRKSGFPGRGRGIGHIGTPLASIEERRVAGDGGQACLGCWRAGEWPTPMPLLTQALSLRLACLYTGFVRKGREGTKGCVTTQRSGRARAHRRGCGHFLQERLTSGSAGGTQHARSSGTVQSSPFAAAPRSLVRHVFSAGSTVAATRAGIPHRRLRRIHLSPRRPHSREPLAPALLRRSAGCELGSCRSTQAETQGHRAGSSTAMSAAQMRACRRQRGEMTTRSLRRWHALAAATARAGVREGTSWLLCTPARLCAGAKLGM
jgi:hypothetical protein